MITYMREPWKAVYHSCVSSSSHLLPPSAQSLTLLHTCSTNTRFAQRPGKARFWQECVAGTLQGQ